MIFIAEIGLNHNGNLDLGYEMIKQAKYSGAHIAKFQLGWRANRDELNFIDKERISKFKKCAEYYNIELMFSVFNDHSFEILKNFNLNYYKIASRTVKENIDLVKKISDLNKTTFISLGMWDKPGVPIPIRENIKYLWCKSIYPTLPEQMTDFPKNFNETNFSGYSDHTIGIETAILAISRGANIIEKHFTLDKSDVTIRDHVLSATPDEFRNMVQIGNDIYKKINIGI